METLIDNNNPLEKNKLNPYKGNKVIDFLMGFLVGAGFIILGFKYESETLLVLYIIGFTAAIIVCFIHKRKFIAKGILLSVLLCVIFVIILIGTCSIRF